LIRGEALGEDVEMAPTKDRKQMEERFGEIGTGLVELEVAGKRYDLYQLLKMVGMDHADIRPIDAHRLEGDRFAIRYFDIEERFIVAYEFGPAFEYLGEHAAHIDEWMGDEYYNFPWAIYCPDSP
jgi:hypothetical protein